MSNQEQMRLAAAKALVELGGGETALPVLLDLARMSNQEQVRLAAAEKLTQMGQEETALPALSDLVHTADQAHIRREAARVLADFAEIELLKLAGLSPPNDFGALASLVFLETLTH